jgi:hypothetical protein
MINETRYWRAAESKEGEDDLEVAKDTVKRPALSWCAQSRNPVPKLFSAGFCDFASLRAE